MPLSSVTYTANGSTSDFSLTFDYLQQSDVSVLLNSVPTAFTWTSPSVVHLASPPSNGVKVTILRTTSISSPAVDFVDGSTITQDDLDAATRQSLYGLQELEDQQNGFSTLISQATITGSALPAVTGADLHDLLMVDGTGTWVKTTFNDFKSILGITVSAYQLPAPGGGTHDGFLSTAGGQWVKILPSDVLTALGIDTLTNLMVTINGGVGFGTAALLNSGTAIGDVLLVADSGGGTPALPVLYGGQLTGVMALHGYIRIEEQQTYSTDGGGYPTANSWQKRTLNTLVLDETGLVTIASGDVTLPPGSYMFNCESYANGIGSACIRMIDTSDGSVIFRGVVQFSGTASGTEKVNPDVFGRLNLSATKTIEIQIFGTNINTDSVATGKAHNSATLGSNIYTVLELWKIQ